MARKSEPSLDSQLDAALGEVLTRDWIVRDEPPADPVAPPPAPLPTLETPQYPPVPVREELEPQAHGGALMRTRVVPEGEEARNHRALDLGLLTDLAAGRKSATQAAQAAGLTEEDLQASLAVALREVPPEEIAKAMGLQAAEQQLKSGALYGAVIADLVVDLAAGRLKPETKIELAKMLARVGRVEPKDDKNAGAGSGFVLNLHVGSADPKPITIEAGQ